MTSSSSVLPRTRTNPTSPAYPQVAQLRFHEGQVTAQLSSDLERLHDTRISLLTDIVSAKQLLQQTLGPLRLVSRLQQAVAQLEAAVAHRKTHSRAPNLPQTSSRVSPSEHDSRMSPSEHDLQAGSVFAVLEVQRGVRGIQGMMEALLLLLRKQDTSACGKQVPVLNSPCEIQTSASQQCVPHAASARDPRRAEMTVAKSCRSAAAVAVAVVRHAGAAVASGMCQPSASAEIGEANLPSHPLLAPGTTLQQIISRALQQQLQHQKQQQRQLQHGKDPLISNNMQTQQQ